MSPPRDKTEFDRAIEEHDAEIRRLVAFVAHRRGLFHADADDVLQKAYELAYERESAGKHWDPQKKAVTLHMAEMASNAARSIRRGMGRRPADAIQQGQDFASAAPNAPEIMEEHEERMALVQKVRALCVEETNGGLCARVMDAVAAGTTARKDIATELQCEIEDVHNAMKRLERRTRKIASGGGGD